MKIYSVAIQICEACLEADERCEEPRCHFYGQFPPLIEQDKAVFSPPKSKNLDRSG